MRLGIKLLDFFCNFVTGACAGLFGMLLVDQILCPGIFLDHNRLLLGWALLTGTLGIIILPGACDD